MKIRADENVAPAIVRVVRDLALSEGFELTSIIEIGQAGAGDVHWITRFAQEGGQAILSGDKDFLRSPPQVDAVNRLGLRVIHMPGRWCNARGHMQTSHLLMWWPRIERKLAEMAPRDCYSPPWNVAEDGQLKQVVIPYADAEKKLKRAAKRDAAG